MLALGPTGGSRVNVFLSLLFCFLLPCGLEAIAIRLDTAVDFLCLLFHLIFISVVNTSSSIATRVVVVDNEFGIKAGDVKAAIFNAFLLLLLPCGLEAIAIRLDTTVDSTSSS